MERLGIATKRKPAKVIDFTRYIDTNRSSTISAKELLKQLFGHKKLVCNDEKQDV